MKVKNNRLYPYPVLSEEHDDYIDNTFKVENLLLEHDSETAEITGSVVIADETIKNFLRTNKVSLFCHVECSTTKFRQIFQIDFESMSSFKIVIPLKNINDTIEICFVLVANTNIENYKNDNLHSRYFDANITLFQYRTLGYTETEEFKIKKQLDTNGEIPSIFDITKSETEDNITFDYMSGDKIVIYLPANDYAVYENSKGVAIRIKQMLTVIPVLSELLETLKNEGTDDFSDKGWFIVLEKAISKLPGFSDGFESDNFRNLDSSFKLAQLVFKQISHDAFNELEQLMEALG